MKLFTIAILAAFLLSTTAFAGVPPMISYQGKLMQPGGAPVPDGTCSIQFAIYDAATGGTPLWSETNNSVHVKGGLFSVLLGSVVNLPANIFDQPNRFFGVKVGSDPEMTPRQQIASTAYAFKAGTVEDGAITTGKLADENVTTTKIMDGAVTSAKLQPVEALQGFAFINGWHPYGLPFSDPGFYKDAFGIVHLQGVIRRGPAQANCTLNLPAGYVPAKVCVFHAASNIQEDVHVEPDGTVRVTDDSVDWVSLDGISFRAGQ